MCLHMYNYIHELHGALQIQLNAMQVNLEVVYLKVYMEYGWMHENLTNKTVYNEIMKTVQK